MTERGSPSSLPTLAEALRSGELEVASYLDHLEERFAAREPEVLAFVEEDGRFARLRREAQELLARYPEPASRPALFGVPVGVKDVFHAAGFPTRAGSGLPPEELAPGKGESEEAESVARLRDAGALVLGKTVTTEFATFAPGPTRNPWHPAHTPGGSSSGSAAAVGAGLAPLALGTQTIGSIGRPASFCGVVGFKPSYERISRAGLIAVAPSLDHVGCFAADTAGACLAASVLCAGWSPVAPPAFRPVLGVPEGPYLERASADGLARFRAACERLAVHGFVLRPVAAFADFDAIEARHRHLFDGEMARGHQAWFARHEDLYREKTVEIIRRGQAVTEAELETARAGRSELRNALTALAAAEGVDLWISPSSTGPAPEGLEWTGDPVMNLPWTHAGLPAVTLPMAVATLSPGGGELPMGLQLAGRFGEDENLLAWAAEVEKALA